MARSIGPCWRYIRTIFHLRITTSMPPEIFSTPTSPPWWARAIREPMALWLLVSREVIFRCAVASLYEVVSVRPSVRPSVCPVLFSKVKRTHTRRILCRVSGLVRQGWRFFSLVLEKEKRKLFFIFSANALRVGRGHYLQAYS